MFRYSPEFRASVLEFARTHTNFVTRQQFRLPDTTLRVWLKQAGVERSGWRSGNNNVGEGDDVVSSDQLMCSSSTIQQTVLHFSKKYGLKEACMKFNIPISTLKQWTRKAGKRLTKNIDEDQKLRIVEFGVRVNSWKLASRKFHVHQSTIGLWARRFGLKLRPGGRETCELGAEAEDWDMSSDEETDTADPPSSPETSERRLDQQTIICDDRALRPIHSHVPSQSSISTNNNNHSGSGIKKRKIKKEIWIVKKPSTSYNWKPVKDELVYCEWGKEEIVLNVPDILDADTAPKVEKDELPFIDCECCEDSCEDTASVPHDVLEDREWAEEEIVCGEDVLDSRGYMCDVCGEQLSDADSLLDHCAINHENFI